MSMIRVYVNSLKFAIKFDIVNKNADCFLNVSHRLASGPLYITSDCNL